MPVTNTYNTSQDVTIPADIYSMRIRLSGAGGGGENITADYNITPTPATSGGSTSYIGLIAGGGQGGGIGGRNNGGNGGTTSSTFNWGTYGANVSTSNGSRGGINAKGAGGTIGSLVGKNGGDGSTGIFTYSSYIQHVYSPITQVHYVTNSSPDLSVQYLGLELGGVSCSVGSIYKHYYVQFNIPFVNSDFEIYAPDGITKFENTTNGFCQQAAGGSTTGPFYISGGGGPNQNKLTEVRVSEYPGTIITQSWRSTTNYGAGNFVTYGADAYRATATSYNQPPPANPDKWQLLTVSSRKSYFSVWFCRAGGPTYVRCINFVAKGQRQSSAGRGGGGGAVIETTITRDMFINSVTYAPGTTHALTVGAKGSKGGNNSNDGLAGTAELYMIIVPTVYLTANVYVITLGQSVNLSWTTTGDADSISWTAGGLSNGNLTSSATVSPTETTTYTAVASGLGGSSTPASVTIIVNQPPTASITLPTSLDYGTQGTIQYSCNYANTSITITPYFSYIGLPETAGTAITITPVSSSSQKGVAGSSVSGSVSTNIVYTTLGPRTVRYLISAVGDGGTATQQKTIDIIIDETPDNIIVPETEGVFKAQDPVVTPDTDVVSEFLEVLDIDIPVEIKANAPIQVDINGQQNWQNIRQM